MTKPHLILWLDAPLMAFGTTLIDAHGPVQDFPAASLLTGLLANALGYRRTETERLQALQDRLAYAVRLDDLGERVEDFQTADIAQKDVGWTTRGAPEGRAGGAGTYKGKHIQRRVFNADARATLALRLEPADAAPTLEDLARALDRPARPLFIGRKPCLPAGPLRPAPPGDIVRADTALEAVRQAAPPPFAPNLRGQPRFFWPETEGPPSNDRRDHTGKRRWRTDLHGGLERWFAAEEAELSARLSP